MKNQHNKQSLVSKDEEMKTAFAELEQGVHAALETYSNVHRGSGHNSMVSTHLFEQARDIVLEYLGLKKSKYVVIFSTPRRVEILTRQLNQEAYQVVSSKDIGLSIGVRALAVKRKALPRGIPFQTGGGTTKLISQGWVIWANAPDKFEAGTPAIVNIIAFAKALCMIGKYGNEIFKDLTAEKLTITEILYKDELEEYSGQELLDKLRQTLIGRGNKVPTMEGTKLFTNLDNSASTPTFMPIWNAFRQTLVQSEQVKQEIINEVRSICSDILGAPLTSYDMIFTSNTTEAINLAAESLSRKSEEETQAVVINTFLEHSSNDLPWRKIPGYSLIRLLVDADGLVDLNALDRLLSAYNKEGQYGKKRIKLVTITGASNVLGVCNDITEIARIVHKYGAFILVDAAQLVAHRKIDMKGSEIDYLAFSAHKVYAPFGCGVLMARKGLLNFSPADLELIQSSGEENAGGIVALGKAFVLLKRIGMDIIQEEEQALTRTALIGLSQIAGLKMYGIKNPDSPLFTQKLGVIVFELKNMMGDKVAKKLAVQCGIGVRYGCHCAHIIIKHILKVGPFLEGFQRVLLTLFPKLQLPGLVRVSLGIENSEEDIDRLIHSLNKISQPSRNASASKDSEKSKLTKTEIQLKMNDFVRDSSLRVFPNSID
ncbi:aminotransferase class V-fold PLP-dependent enzyme [Bacteroidota bacterium]